MSDETLFIGGGGPGYSIAQELLLRFGNRHGLIAGATGTGKTVSLQILAEGFSKAGVPVFMADVKGDLSGLAMPGTHEHKLHDKLIERATTIGFDDYGYEDFPVVFWDLFSKKGHPIRTTISEMGPLLLARLLGLNETQEGVLNIAFALADAEGMLLLDLKDLRAMLNHIGNNAAELSTSYGYVTKASVGAIQRRLLVLEQQGGKKFFGEPALELKDMIATNECGEGSINILAADKLVQAPRLYATFLLWLLSELFEELPEVGDPDKPRCRLLLRRGASAVRGCAQGADRQGRAGGASDPFQGRRRLFHHPEPGRRARRHSGPARQPRSARPARLHAARSKGAEARRRRRSGQTRASKAVEANSGSGHRRGACLHSGNQRRALAWWSAR